MHRSDRARIACYACALAFLVPGACRRLAAQSVLPSVVGKVYSVNTRVQESSKFTIIVTNNKTGQTRTIQANEWYRTINEMRLYGDHVVIIIGDMLYAGKLLSIYHLDNAALINEIQCYGYGISDDNRMIIYQTFYGRMEMPDYRRSILMLYDIEKPTEKYPNYSGSALNVGIPVFPEENARRGSDDPMLTEKYSYLSPLLWSEDRQRIAAIVFDSKSEINVVVLIDISGGLDKPIVRRKEIDLAKIAGLDALRPETSREFMKKPYKFVVTSIAWSGKKAIVVTPYHQNWLPNQVLLELPEE